MMMAGLLRIPLSSPPATTVYHQQQHFQPRIFKSGDHLSLTEKKFFLSTRSRVIVRSSLGDGGYGSSGAFPRINIRDPYKRLGISREASEEEIREAHNFLIKQYGGDEKSRASIESAYDKILSESLKARRRPKFDIKNAIKKKYAQLPLWVRNIPNIYDVPSSKAIITRAIFFFILGVWSVFFPARFGPTFQVAISLGGCIYFLYRRLRIKWKALLFGFISFLLGWIFASVVVAFLPAIYPKSWSIELVSALVSYVFLWFSCTFFGSPVLA